ncbi:bifunctional DNA primase/polymerase [Pseudonocardia sp. GCM10023141]|uniref:bifunctional DNA primase/polymerase n=1 Tax=Pseudonocardia sp. GCM10023141 TaxID=3252653 RepID=UPI00360A4BA5
MNTETTREALLQAALDTAGRGWPVFPLRAGSKLPALHGAGGCPASGDCVGGHQGWEPRASTDPDRIRQAWRRAPFNIGLATGPAGLVVVDLDSPKPGAAPPPQWARLDITCGADVLAAIAEQARETVPATWTVATPTGGRHLYFTAPAGAELRNTQGDKGRGLGWLIDTRAHGVVAAVAVSSRVRVLIEALSAAMRRARSSTLCVSSPDAVDAAGAAFGGLRR